MEPLPLHVETAIYLYFGLVAAIGCYLHGRLWLASQRGESRGDDGANPN